jgi:hypothetical protein
MKVSAVDYALTYATTLNNSKVKVTLRRAVYRQSVRLGNELLETYNQ